MKYVKTYESFEDLNKELWLIMSVDEKFVWMGSGEWAPLDELTQSTKPLSIKMLEEWGYGSEEEAIKFHDYILKTNNYKKGTNWVPSLPMGPMSVLGNSLGGHTNEQTVKIDGIKIQKFVIGMIRFDEENPLL